MTAGAVGARSHAERGNDNKAEAELIQKPRVRGRINVVNSCFFLRRARLKAVRVSRSDTSASFFSLLLTPRRRVAARQFFFSSFRAFRTPFPRFGGCEGKGSNVTVKCLPSSVL